MSLPRPQAEPTWASAAHLLLPLLVVVAWLPGISAPYQYDDYNTPVGDPASQSLTSWWHAMPQTLRPLTKLTYALESSLGAIDAPSRRLFNTLAFGVCVVLVRAILRKVGTSALVSLAVAVVWAVHPVHAETIVALAGRPVLLCLCFTLASALLLLSGKPWWALASAALAVGARESGLPWLVACSALSAHRLGMSRRALTATAGGVSVLGLAALLSVHTLRDLVTSSLTAAGAVNRLGLQWAALFRGTLGLIIDPSSFTLDMDFAPTGAPRLAMILGAFGLYAGGLWLAFRPPGARQSPERRDALRVAAVLWLCLVIPTHSVIPKVDPFTARPFSASLAPLLLLITYGVQALARRLTVTTRHDRAWGPLGLTALGLTALGLVAGLLVPLTHRRAALYQDPVALWRDAAERSEHKTRPLLNLGTLLAKRGQLREAEGTLEAALARDRGSLEARARLGAIRRLRSLNNEAPPSVAPAQ